MRRRASELHDLVGIREAAARLGVSLPTLRRWDKARKLVAERHPLTGERVYRREALEALAGGGIAAVHEPSILGRDAELRKVSSAIRAGARLLSLVGPGGIGKTALAQEALAELAASHRVFFCDLTSADGERVVSTLGATLGIELGAASDDEARLGLIARHLARLRAVVLVLDNAEHVTAAVAAAVRVLRARVPELAIVVTSRERLRLRDELVLELGPLPPDAAVQLLLRAAERAGATIERARHAKVLARIAARLEGIPLALELAGAQLATLEPDELRARLEQSFELLENRMRDAPPRHATLHAAIAGSFELLAPNERAVFNALSVFRGGFDAPAAEAVAGRGAARVLGSLRDKSLLRSVPGSAPRFDLFLSIRDFAAQKLAESGPAEGAEERHARWFAALAKTALEAPPTDIAVEPLVREHDNLRVASAWATSHDAELALLFAIAIDYAAGTTSSIDERVRMLDAAIASSAKAGRRLVARALATRGRLLLERGDARRSVRDLENAYQVARRARDSELSVYVLGLLAACAIQFGTPAEALRAAARAERATRLGPAHPTRALTWTQIGSVQHELGALERAEANFAHALALAVSAGQDVLAARIRVRLGRAFSDMGRARDAEDALAAVEELRGDRFEAWALAHRALLAWRAGRLDDAREDYERAVNLFAARGASGFETVHRALLASVLAAEGRGVDALAEIARARIDAGDDAGLCVAVELAEAHRELLEARRSGSDPEALVRDALKRSRRWCARDKDLRALAERLGAVAGEALPSRPTLFVAHDGAWLTAPGKRRAELPAGSPLRSLLVALATRHASAEHAALSRDELVAAAWPRERMLPRAAAQRIYAAMSELRGLGLGSALERTALGYRLAPRLSLRIEGDQP